MDIKPKAKPSGGVYDTVLGFWVGSRFHDQLRGAEGDDRLDGGAGDDHLRGSEGHDLLRGNEGEDHLWGGYGNDVLESQRFYDGLPLSTGAPFSYERILGLDGNDTLNGGGRHGAYLDGGQGDDVLIQSFVECLGGPGADTFVAGGRGGHTSPDASIRVLDFNGSEGDRLYVRHFQALDSADLFARGCLRFDPATGNLVLDFDPSTASPTSVDQVFVLVGVTAFDPSWVSVGPAIF